MLVSCVHPVFCMTCSLLLLVEDASGDYMEDACSKAGFMSALWVDMSVSFCLPHAVAVGAFIICRGLCACTDKTLCKYGCLHSCLCADVICIRHDMNHCSGWWSAA